MGNQQCEECKQVKNQNTAYGQFQVCHFQGKQIALIEKKLQLKPGLAEKIHKELEKRTKINCKNIVRLHRFEVAVMEYELSINMYYEYMPKTLKEFIYQLDIKEEDITEKQLFNIVYGVQMGLESLYSMGIQHGCVNLETILFKNNIFKITDISSTTNLTSYQLVCQGNMQQFLSQKLLNNLSYKIIKPNDFNIADDLFSLGLIVLMIISKGKPQNFYNWHKTQKMIIATFNIKYIEHCLRLMNRNYSSKLCNKIKSFVLISKQVKFEEVESSSLTSELQDLNQDMSRVLNKIKYGAGSYNTTSNQSTLRNSLYQTPFKKLH